MYAPSLRKILLGISMMAMLLMALVAYGRYAKPVKAIEEECCVQDEASVCTEMPWEAVASQWFKAVAVRQ